ncbi:T-complex protein 1 subunit zeta 2 [Capsicum baccatum]|uniref:T-complex protein 1 subunit zeta 2 n=1 Tax=Capsicum baccatum TaxID=33114 RepID=A0A2G2WTG0_CAPBA|nr:T-complex protein 1 subunit zeta 2 [Capsicum baccatum]
MSVKVLNPNVAVLNKSAALHMNINAAKGLQDVLKTNLELVGDAGDIKLTKDGNTLLKEMVSSYCYALYEKIGTGHPQFTGEATSDSCGLDNQPMHEDKSRNNGKTVEISPLLTLADELGNSNKEQIAQVFARKLVFFGLGNLLQLSIIIIRISGLAEVT